MGQIKGRAYIYGLFAPDDEAPFYVGSTIYPDKRLADHLSAVRYGQNANRHFCNKVRALDYCIEMRILEEVAQSDRWDAEVKHIHCWREKIGEKLTNRYHNGFRYSHERSAEEYQEQHVLTPEKLRLGIEMRDRGFMGDPGSLEEKLHTLIVRILEVMERKYPDEMQALLNGEAQDVFR